MRFNLLTLVFGALGIAWVVGLFWGPPWSVLRLFGLALGVASFALLCVARLELGRAFHVRAKAEMLVTTGIYARMRNPIYIFGTLTLCGLVLWANRPWLLWLLLLLVPMQVYRARNEARVLAERFGQEYEAYRRSTWF